MNARPWYRSIAATEKLLHEYAEHPRIELSYTDHAKERMYERDIDGEDVMHVLMHGHVSVAPEPTNRPDCYTCKICAKTPNSGSRTICVVVIPNIGMVAAKVITVMWEDLK